jgi:8-oxo-dGTP pyrophosphatase MutT (NUDIX family)
MAVIDKFAWIYVKNKRLLCTRSKGSDTFYLPGGKRKPNESGHEALVREIKEELNVDLLHPLKFFGSFEAQAHGKQSVVRLSCYSAPFKGKISPGSEIEGIAWLSHRQRDRLTEAGQIVLDKLKESGLID